MRKSWALVASAFIAVLSTVLLLIFTEQNNTPEPTAPVVVFTSAVGDREPIQSNQVSVKQYPITLAPKGVISDPGQVIGKYVALPSEAGQIVFRSALRTDNLKNGVREGKVLVGIPVNLITSAGVLKVGDVVDVAVASSDNLGGQKPTQARILYRDLRVMALKNQQGQDVNGLQEKDNLTPTGTGDVTPAMATLEASPEQAVDLFLATQQGTMALFVDPWGNAKEDVQ